MPCTTHAEFKNKKVALVAVPGAFTPTCSEKHIPTFVEEKEALKAKGIDQVVVIAYNDAFVMSAWGKANGVKDDFIVSPTPYYNINQHIYLHAHKTKEGMSGLMVMGTGL